MISKFNQKISDFLGSDNDEKLKAQFVEGVFIEPNHLDYANIKFKYRNWKDETVEKSVFLFRTKTDFSLALYPLVLFATNKMANTVVSRQSRSNVCQDLRLIRNCSPQGLLLGLVPFTLYSIHSQVSWYIYERRNAVGCLQPVTSTGDKVISSMVHVS